MTGARFTARSSVLNVQMVSVDKPVARETPLFVVVGSALRAVQHGLARAVVVRASASDQMVVDTPRTKYVRATAA